MKPSFLSTSLISVVLLAGFTRAGGNEFSPEAGYGPHPKLPPTDKEIIPTVDIAPAKGWPAGKTPVAAPGLAVNAFAADLDHPRTVYVLPTGDVLVAQTNAPERPDEGKSIKGVAMGIMMKKAGAAVPSANNIILLRDSDGDGVAEKRFVFLKGLNSPFGIALVGDNLYVANSDAVVRFPYKPGATTIDTPPQKVADLPAGTINHHWTKSLAASRDGKKLFVGVGSNSNVGENGLDKEESRAAILQIDLATGNTSIFASGLRNPTALALQPGTDALWAVVNERDELGNDLVPDYLTQVHEGAFYGWPFSYYGQNLDPRVKTQNPALVARALAPDYALGSHTAPLGLAFADGKLLPQKYARGVFIGQHGSWNRKPLVGYGVIFVPFADGKPSGMPEPVLTGFLNSDGDAMGRPVGVAVDQRGALLVADDVGNVIWRVISLADRTRATQLLHETQDLPTLTAVVDDAK